MSVRQRLLAFKYAGLIDIMLSSVNKSDLGTMVRERPGLLSDGAMSVVELMLDNARSRSDSHRADQLAAIRQFLSDARSGGVDLAILAIPEMGPLPFQQADNELVIGFLAADSLAAAKTYITDHTVLLTSEYDEALARLADIYRQSDTMQGITLDNARWLFQRCREVGIDAALAERPYLFRYGEPDESDLEGQSRLASDLLQEEGEVARGYTELIVQVPLELTELQEPGTLAMIRYARTGALKDLDVALASWKQVVEHPAYAATPLFFRAAVMSDVGVVLFQRYRTEGRSHDLDDSIEYLQRAVDLQADNSSERLKYTSNLAAALRERAALHGPGDG
jgi:hypothetical protein